MRYIPFSTSEYIVFKTLAVLCLALFSTSLSFASEADLAQSTQAIVVHSAGGFGAKLEYWVRKNTHSKWKKKMSDVDAVVGRNGFAPIGAKVEGDGDTPSGIYKIPMAFGYADRINTKLDYRKATENSKWVDDVNSPDYNKWVEGPTDAKSFENMKRNDVLYKTGAVISYNTDPVVKGKGSAIFLHIWRLSTDPTPVVKPTAGCVASDEKTIAKLLRRLDAKRNPVIVLNPNYFP